MDIYEGYVPFKNNYYTYFRIVEPNRKKTPLLFLHGGPGSTHNSFELLDELAVLTDRPIIMYDQFGCGLSFTGEVDENLYCKETWVEELINLRNVLGLTKVHLMGHSWGGMLAIIYLCDYQPEGICSVHLSSTLASASLWAKETHRLLSYLPKQHQDAIYEAERTNNYSSEDFIRANKEYSWMYVADYDRIDPNSSKEFPSCLTREKKRGDKAYLKAWGPSEFQPLGNLKNYEYLDKLSKLTLPVLITNGADDESTPLQNKAIYDKLTNVPYKEWKIFSPSRHVTYYEQKDEYMKTTKEFIDHIEREVYL